MFFFLQIKVEVYIGMLVTFPYFPFVCGFYKSFKRWKCSGEENDYKMPDWEKKEEETNCGVSRIHIYRIPILFHSHIQLYLLSPQSKPGQKHHVSDFDS